MKFYKGYSPNYAPDYSIAVYNVVIRTTVEDTLIAVYLKDDLLIEATHRFTPKLHIPIPIGGLSENT